MSKGSPPVALLSAGGSGGHLFPAEALAKVLAGRGWQVHLATDTRAAQFLRGFENASIHKLHSATPFGRSLLKAVAAFFTLAVGLAEALWLVWRIKPSVFVGFGGYPTLPPGAASWLMRVPVVLHEQNAAPGRANRFLARFAKAAARGLPGAPLHPRALDAETGNPVREAVLNARQPYLPPEADGPLRLLVFGGSQGARVFSSLLADALGEMEPAERQRIHLTLQVRPADHAACAARLEELGVKSTLAPFFDDLPEKIASAHLVIARAGASTLAELAILGRPSLLVPYPYALDHDQAQNARLLQEAGAAEVIAQKDLTPLLLAQRLQALWRAPERLAKAAKAAQRLARADASLKLAELVMRLAKQE